MIANSHPTNPSQQMQRCIGINQEQQRHEPMTRILTSQQQNTLYGSSMPPPSQQASSNLRPTSHMFDLANLQQHQHQQQANAGNLFDSAYDEATSSANQSDHHHHQSHNNHNDISRLPMLSNTSNHKQITNDMSLYSPSSSTSLLYHVYDQISVPNEQQAAAAAAANQQQNFKRSNTTILNPANLFNNQSQTTMANQYHQHQQHATTNGQSIAQLNNGGKTTIPQQELYSSGTQFHLQQPSFNNNNNTLHHYNPHNNGLDNHHQLMLDTILRQQHAVAAAAKTQQQQHYHNRPLSSSGASSMSGQSMPLTYGRQPRQTANLPPLPPINASKSQNTLASVLQSNQTLNHLGLSLNGHLPSATIDARGPKKLGHHQFPTATSSSSSSGGVGAGAAILTSRKWKRAQHRVRHFAYEYSTLLICSMLLILLAFILMSYIKFNPSSTSTMPLSSYQNTQHNLHSSPPSNINHQHTNPLIYSTTKPLDPTTGDLDQAPGAPDMLKSKLLIGEFVILNQNYSQSSAQRSLLAENIVKLMDQVFLSTEVRRVYSQMKVTDIRPHRSSSGITVTCNIFLGESITYAAQQFGIALYDSLNRTNEKLANHASFVIDKNSIRFNTVPDKDLPIVPPELISPSFPRDSLPSSQMAPSIGGVVQRPSQPLDEPLTPTVMDSQAQAPSTTSALDQNSVVWSEWSQWSSCVDKNGLCDPGRLHSRIRKCVAQTTGEKVDAIQCRQRYGMQDRELELADCSASCSSSSISISISSSGNGNGMSSGGDPTMSDAPISPSVLPITAPSLMPDFAPAFNLAPPPSFTTGKPAQVDGQSSAEGGSGSSQDPYASAQGGPSTTQASATAGSTQTSGGGPLGGEPSSTPLLLTVDNSQQQQQQQMSCSNCTSDAICLLLAHEKVPFCAKIKDRADESGCGGWCKAQSQLCQPVGQNAFKCVHDSECLADEWRCHDSLCIPMSKRCDGHSNCYDNSDERDCPARK